MTDRPPESTTDDLLLAFYGDDFTGSTDALEGLADNGVRAVLYFEPPSPAEVAQFDELEAIGVAGATRSMSPAAMTEELQPAFEALSALDVPIVHYKVCSTFDSAPSIGSIGHAIDVGQSVFDSPFVPVSQGTEVPHGRYVVFSNLFAVEGGETYRIDRHPTMKDHPVTPMEEGDLRRHLGAQTERSIGRLDVHDLSSLETAKSALRSAQADGDALILDALDTTHLGTIGRLLWSQATSTNGPLFVVGSSGLEHHALVEAWAETGRIDRSQTLYRKRDPVDQTVVVSGSASPTTAAQIDWAEANGFQTMSLPTPELVDPETALPTRETVVSDALEVLESGESVVLYSARGPDDPTIKTTRRRFDERDIGGSLERRLGRQQGLILRDLLERYDLTRVCIAGGDTSSHATPELEARALEAIAPIGPGAPLCRMHADNSSFDGLEIALKGGQIGTRNENADYFGAVREGGVER